MPMKCVVVRLHVAPIGPNTDPDKVAAQVMSSLKGASHFPWKLSSVEAWNCHHPEPQLQTLDWWTELLKGVAPQE